MLKRSPNMAAVIKNWLLLSLIILKCEGNYNIYRSACRHYAVFKLTDRDKKMNGGLISVNTAKSVAHCQRNCLASSACLTFNFNPLIDPDNCQLLTSSRSAGGILEEAMGWKHYEAISQPVTPGCLVLGTGNACSPGYICQDSCSGSKRFDCIDIDECASSPCRNGGTCNNLTNRFECSCVAGYTGVQCEIDINECASNPCYNGGNCNNYVNYYTCSCVNGYSGTRCETAPSSGGGEGGGGWWG